MVAGADPNAALRAGSLGLRGKRHGGARPSTLDVLKPNRIISPTVMQIVIWIEAIGALIVWTVWPLKILPRPVEVLHAFRELWMHQGLGQELGVSFGLNLEALAVATVLALGLSYLTVLPVFRPIVAAVGRGRFLSLTGFTFIFTAAYGGGRPLKLMMLVFAMTVFYVTSMASVIAQIPRSEFDHARTLRMKEWRVVWEVVVLGTVDRAFEVLRQNAAIGWMMLTMVEGIVRSEGGIGMMLLNENKYLKLAAVFAIQGLILIVGLMQDYAIGVLRRVVCPYANLTLERK